MAKDYKLSIRGPDQFSLEYSIDRSGLDAVWHAITSGDEPGRSNEDKPVSISLAEFLEEANARNHVERLVAIAEFLREHRFQQFITREDVILGYEEALITPPSNLSRDIGEALQRGWISQREGTNHYYRISRLGMDSVYRGFRENSEVIDYRR